MNDLLIGLLSALVATNTPAAVSNLVQKKTGLALPVADANDPVEKAYQKLLADDDATQAQVEEWSKENQKAAQTSTDVEKAAFRAKVKRRFELVRKAYDDFLQAHPKHTKARIAYGSFLNEIGEEVAAESEWQKAREQDPKNPAVWNNLANFYGHNGNVQKSFEYYGKAIELEPTEPVYYQNLATTVFLFRKNAMDFYKITEEQVFGKSLSLYRKALELDPKNFDLATDLAQTYYGIKLPASEDVQAARQAQLKQADEAIAAWRTVYKLAADDLDRQRIHLHFARWQINSERFADARKNLDIVTNDYFASSKKTLMKKLESREAASKGANAAVDSTDKPAAPKPKIP